MVRVQIAHNRRCVNIFFFAIVHCFLKLTAFEVSPVSVWPSLYQNCGWQQQFVFHLCSKTFSKLSQLGVVSNCSPALHKGGSPRDLWSKHYWLHPNSWSQRACLTACQDNRVFFFFGHHKMWIPQTVLFCPCLWILIGGISCHCSILVFSFICFPQYSHCSLVQ